jgi:nicotinamide riboside kinase
MKFRRINLFGGPCSGKSTVASIVFSSLKKENYRIELINEYVKQWTYIPRKVKGFDQVFLFANQLHLEDIALRSRSDQLIITDSPILMNSWYGQKNASPSSDNLIRIVHDFERCYPSLNFFILRKEEEYDEHGRFHSLKEAKEIDDRLQYFLENKFSSQKISHLEDVNVKNSEEVISKIKDKL